MFIAAQVDRETRELLGMTVFSTYEEAQHHVRLLKDLEATAMEIWAPGLKGTCRTLARVALERFVPLGNQEWMRGEPTFWPAMMPEERTQQACNNTIRVEGSNGPG